MRGSESLNLAARHIVALPTCTRIPVYFRMCVSVNEDSPRYVPDIQDIWKIDAEFLVKDFVH